MTMSDELATLVDTTMSAIRQTLETAVNAGSLAEVVDHLMKLADRQDLFDPRSFPFPVDATDRTFLIHDTNGEFALYVCTSTAGTESVAHDHGQSWAVIAAVSGAEKHHFYSVTEGKPRMVGETICKPGNAVSLLPGEIHSIHAQDEPFVHLHLYGQAFDLQMERREFDATTGVERRFELKDMSFIEDRRR